VISLTRKKHSYRLSYLYKSATTISTADHMEAASLEITLKPVSQVCLCGKHGGRRGTGRTLCNAWNVLCVWTIMTSHAVKKRLFSPPSRKRKCECGDCVLPVGEMAIFCNQPDT